MPSNPGHVPAYKLHKPTGQARVILRGKHVYLGPYGSPESREKYGRLVAEFAVNATADDPRAPGEKLLIVQLAARYWEFAERYYLLATAGN